MDIIVPVLLLLQLQRAVRLIRVNVFRLPPSTPYPFPYFDSRGGMIRPTKQCSYSLIFLNVCIYIFINDHIITLQLSIQQISVISLILHLNYNEIIFLTIILQVRLSKCQKNLRKIIVPWSMQQKYPSPLFFYFCLFFVFLLILGQVR